MSEMQESNAIVKQQNFDDIVASLTDFSERSAQKHKSLGRVEPRRTILGTTRTPTIDDINKVVDSIDGQLISLKNFNMEVLKVLTGVAVALSALDKEHISGILITANLAKEASEQAVENVKSISAVISMLKSQQHLKNIDQTWEDLEKQKEVIETLTAYRDELLKITHLRDMDKLWEDVDTQGKSVEEIDKAIEKITKTLRTQGETVFDLTGKVKDISEKEQAVIDSASQYITERQKEIDQSLEDHEKAFQDSLAQLSEQSQKSFESIDRKTLELSEAQAHALDSMSKVQAEKLSRLERTLTMRLNAIDTAQNEKLANIGNAQAQALSHIESEQTERFKQLSIEQTEIFDRLMNEQAERLDRLSRVQIEKLEEINRSLEEEKAALHKTAAGFARKVKTAYIIAGGAVVIMIAHVLLNVFGIL